MTIQRRKSPGSKRVSCRQTTPYSSGMNHLIICKPKITEEHDTIRPGLTQIQHKHVRSLTCPDSHSIWTGCINIPIPICTTRYRSLHCACGKLSTRSWFHKIRSRPQLEATAQFALYEITTRRQPTTSTIACNFSPSTRPCSQGRGNILTSHENFPDSP